MNKEMNTDTNNEVARLREQLTRVLEIAEKFRFYTKSYEWLSMKDELDKIKAEHDARLAPAPEKPLTKKPCSVCVPEEQCWECAPSVCEEPTIAKSVTAEPSPEWRIRAEGERIEPLEKELDYLTSEASRAADIHNHVLIVDCLRYLRDEIEKLKKNQK